MASITFGPCVIEAGFLHRVFVVPNVRVMAAADLSEALEDELYALRDRLGVDGIETKALALRDKPPVGEMMHIADTAAEAELAFERPLYPKKISWT